MNFDNNLIAYDIRGNKIEFKNDKNRVFIILANFSCTNCINQTIYKINQLRQNLIDSCEYILIIQESPKYVLNCRNKITYFSKKFSNIDNFLFGYDKQQESYLSFANSENENYPIIIIFPQNSDFIYIETFGSFDWEKILNIIKK